MSASLWNGKAYFAAYRMDAAHTGIYDAATGVTEATTPAISDAALELVDSAADEIIVQASDWSPDKDGIYTGTIETNDPALLAFLDIACPPKKGAASSIVKKEYTSEAGTKIGGSSSSSGIQYLIISAGAFSATEVLCRMAIVTFSPESDKTKTVVGDTTMFSLKFTTSAVKATYVILNALFPAAIFDISPAITEGLRTLTADYYIKRSLMPIAA